MSNKETKGTTVPVAQSAQTPTAATAAMQPANTKKAERKKSVAEELEERLRELTYKKQLADNREVFLNTDKLLQKSQEDLKTQETEGLFETTTARLVFKSHGKTGYSQDEVFAISNIALICKFLDVLRQEIAQKIQDIEAELIF
jgi:exonuclease VII large subunit